MSTARLVCGVALYHDCTLNAIKRNQILSLLSNYVTAVDCGDITKQDHLKTGRRQSVAVRVGVLCQTRCCHLLLSVLYVLQQSILDWIKKTDKLFTLDAYLILCVVMHTFFCVHVCLEYLLIT